MGCTTAAYSVIREAWHNTHTAQVTAVTGEASHCDDDSCGCTHLVLAQAQGWILELLNGFLVKVTIFLPQLQQLERVDILHRMVRTGRLGKPGSPAV